MNILRTLALCLSVIIIAGTNPGTAQVVPAQMGVTPTLPQNSLNVLDPSHVWVPIGNINPGHTFTPVGGGGSGALGLTGTLVGRTAPVWVPSYTAGGTCAPFLGGAPVFCGGTEGRGFAIRNGLLYLINGYWEDTPSAEGAQNAQILVLSGPEVEGNVWQQELNFGALCPSDDPFCALAGSAIANLSWTIDNGGNTGLNVQQLVASIWWQGTSTLAQPSCASGNTPVYIFAKNNTGGDVGGANIAGSPSGTPYYATQIACEPSIAGEGTPQVRSFSQPHIDQVLGPATFTGTLSGGVLTAASVTGNIWIGATIAGAGVNALTVITSQLTGVTGGAGTYQTNKIQALGPETMTVSAVQEMYAGEGPTGVFQCQLNNNRGLNQNPLSCLTGVANAEWNSSHYSGPPCTAQNRIMGFAEIVGSDSIKREYMSSCFGVYVRIDGPQQQGMPTLNCNPDQVIVSGACVQRWKLYWTDPTPVTSLSGLRGLTATKDGALLIGTEGSVGAISGGTGQQFFAIQPYPACVSSPSTCYTAEYQVGSGTAAATGMAIGNTVAPYNNFASYIDELGNQRYLAPQASYATAATTSIPPGPFTLLYLQGGSGGKKIAEAMYTFRNSPSTYNFAYIPQIFPTAMNGTRDMIMSPFPHDCGYFGAVTVLNCAVYATGFDADSRTGMYWCKANPCPTTPPFVPIHNTAWVAKLMYPGAMPY